MNETKKTVKTVLSFVLVLVLIVGTLFGINLPYGSEDVPLDNTDGVTGEVSTDVAPNKEQTETPNEDVPTVDAPVVDEPTVETPIDDTNDVETPVEDENTDDEGVKDDAPQDSTPTDEETEDVDNSADTTVAEPTENQTTATEGDVENA